MTDWVVLSGAAVRQARYGRHPEVGSGRRQADVSTDLRRLCGGWGFSQSRISSIEREANLAHWVTPWQATALAAVLQVPVWDILASAAEQRWDVLHRDAPPAPPPVEDVGKGYVSVA
jgi:hypothetical protein